MTIRAKRAMNVCVTVIWSSVNCHSMGNCFRTVRLGSLTAESGTVKYSGGLPMNYDSSLYTVYEAIFHARKQSPELWTDGYSTTVLTALMGGRAWGWPVVGVTPAALEVFAGNDYRYKSRSGVTRAHLRPRIETMREAMSGDNPLSEEEFFWTWNENDKTILCARGENKNNYIPDFIPIENPNAQLFSSRKVSWTHRKPEIELLRKLHAEIM